jgi:hypothetical protein
VLIELKGVKTLDTSHHAQLLNYLRATEIEVGLLFNFGIRPEFKRMVFENSRKRIHYFGEVSIASLLKAKE